MRRSCAVFEDAHEHADSKGKERPISMHTLTDSKGKREAHPPCTFAVISGAGTDIDYVTTLCALQEDFADEAILRQILRSPAPLIIVVNKALAHCFLPRPLILPRFVCAALCLNQMWLC